MAGITGGVIVIFRRILLGKRKRIAPFGCGDLADISFLIQIAAGPSASFLDCEGRKIILDPIIQFPDIPNLLLNVNFLRGGLLCLLLSRFTGISRLFCGLLLFRLLAAGIRI